MNEHIRAIIEAFDQAMNTLQSQGKLTDEKAHALMSAKTESIRALVETCLVEELADQFGYSIIVLHRKENGVSYFVAEHEDFENQFDVLVNDRHEVYEHHDSEWCLIGGLIYE